MFAINCGIVARLCGSHFNLPRAAGQRQRSVPTENYTVVCPNVARDSLSAGESGLLLFYNGFCVQSTDAGRTQLNSSGRSDLARIGSLEPDVGDRQRGDKRTENQTQWSPWSVPALHRDAEPWRQAVPGRRNPIASPSRGYGLGSVTNGSGALHREWKRAVGGARSLQETGPSGPGAPLWRAVDWLGDFTRLGNAWRGRPRASAADGTRTRYDGGAPARPH